MLIYLKLNIFINIFKNYVHHIQRYSISFFSIPDKAEILIARLLMMLVMKNGWH